MKKHMLILAGLLFCAGALLAENLPEFDTDLGDITTAWQITYTYADVEETQQTTERAVFVLAEKAAWGKMLPSSGRNLHQIVVPNSGDNLLYNGCSLTYVDDDTVNVYEWRFRIVLLNDAGNPVTEQVALTVGPVTGFVGGIPSGGQLDILNENGTPVRTLDDPAIPATFDLASEKTYILRFSVAKRYEDVSCALTLQPGWNLVGIPLERLTGVGTLLNHLVLDPANNNVRVTDVTKLSGGRAYWVYNGTDAAAVVMLNGQASVVTESHLPTLSARWNFVSPIAKYDAEGHTFIFCDVTGYKWDTEARAFLPVEGAAVQGQGYAVPK